MFYEPNIPWACCDLINSNMKSKLIKGIASCKFDLL